MKRIGITGKGSYIGTWFIKSLQGNKDYEITEIDTKSQDFDQYDFSNFDVIFHVAGIAHQKETEQNAELYYKVNRDLTYQIAKKAKSDGVKQFIFMSSMSVYGMIYSEQGLTADSPCNPNTHYGKSKLQAERLLTKLQSDEFGICILRPPMVYGKDSPGNMTALLNMVRKIRIFPKYINARSFIDIETLMGVLKSVITGQITGILCPQNDEYLCTYEFIKRVMHQEHIKVWYTGLFNLFIKILIGKNRTITKVFGNLYYDRSIK